MYLRCLITALALLCGFTATIAVAIPAAASIQIGGIAKLLVVPRLERPPPDYKQKRDENKWVFGSFQTNQGECQERGKCQMWEPIDPNGRPHPWCQTFSGSNGYTPLQQPTIESARMNEVKDNVSDFPQWVCFFYNNFDCDPSKDKDSAGRGSGFMTDKGPGGGKDASFTTTVGGNRINWFKSYGCMLYDDAPFEDKTTTGKAAEMMASIGMQDLGSGGQMSETLN